MNIRGENIGVLQKILSTDYNKAVKDNLYLSFNKAKISSFQKNSTHKLQPLLQKRGSSEVNLRQNKNTQKQFKQSSFKQLQKNIQISHKQRSRSVNLSLRKKKNQQKVFQKIPITQRYVNQQISQYRLGRKIQSQQRKIRIQTSKTSKKQTGIVKAYAANTNQGLVRNYNQDRLSIIVNINKNQNQQWPICSMFAVYDGHGGGNCADYLRDNLHAFVTKDANFPWNPKGLKIIPIKCLEDELSIRVLCNNCAFCWYQFNQEGSKCYIANIGDSRCILSCSFGGIIQDLSIDHKPNSQKQFNRIISAGGNVYQQQFFIRNKGKSQQIQYPFRVYPGKLSVSRTIGDIQAKFTKYGGNKKVVICQPDIVQKEVGSNWDFLILACDGVFDVMSSEEVIRTIWQSVLLRRQSDIHKQCGQSIQFLMRQAFTRKSSDNISILIIGFQGISKLFQQQSYKLPNIQSMQFQYIKQ